MSSTFDPHPNEPEPTGFLEIGIPEIDAQHREIIRHYEALLRALMEGEDVTAFALSFHSLIHHVAQHFASEEQYMLNIGYDQYAEHKAEHEKLLRDADDFLRSVTTRFEKYDCSGLAKYFRYWIADHVLKFDQQLADFVAKEKAV